MPRVPLGSIISFYGLGSNVVSIVTIIRPGVLTASSATRGRKRVSFSLHPLDVFHATQAYVAMPRCSYAKGEDFWGTRGRSGFGVFQPHGPVNC